MRFAKIIVVLLILLLCCDSYVVYGENQEELKKGIVLQDDTGEVQLDQNVEILVDKNREYTIEDISSGQQDTLFSSYSKLGRPNFGYTSAAYWIRLQIDNNSSLKEWLLEIDTPKINQVALYSPLPNGGFEQRIIGNFYPFSEREFHHRNLIYKIAVDQGEAETFYLRFVTGQFHANPFNNMEPVGL